MHAMGIRILRTYNVQLPHASNVLKAISALKQEQGEFEMYVMLGAWIDCTGAWTDTPNHQSGDFEANQAEIKRAVTLAQTYPEIVKIIAVGNEAMVHWAASYFVEPKVILHWVNHLQGLKSEGSLSPDLWVTSSDNFASWGGGGSEYHKDDLNALIRSVDFVSMHTYPFLQECASLLLRCRSCATRVPLPRCMRDICGTRRKGNVTLRTTCLFFRW